MLKEYAFDVILRGAIRVNADTELAAREVLAQVMDAAECNAGAWPDGAPVLFEASLAADIHSPALYEVDGEAIEEGHGTRLASDTLLGLFCDSLAAWEDEEEAVRAEHAALIESMQAMAASFGY